MEWNNYSFAAHNDDFFYTLLTRRYIFQLTKYEHEGVSESIDSDNRNFFSLVLRNYYSLNVPNFPTLDAYNFGLTRAMIKLWYGVTCLYFV